MKNICVVTAARSEYGPLYPLLSKIRQDEKLDLKLIATGSHLSGEFGFTYRTIEKDGFKIDRKIDMLLSSDTGAGISKSMGLALIGFADYFCENKPDMLILLGDRYELLPICSAAMNEMIPIAHISGGEITEGAIDDSIRHAITKLSYLHFTANEEYRKRVIQLGESPERVFAFGELGLENIFCQKLLSKQELENTLNECKADKNYHVKTCNERAERKLKFSFDDPYALVTFHPVTLELESAKLQFKELLKAIDLMDINVIFTKSNADKGWRVINRLIDEYANNNPEKCTAFENMGELNYLSAMKYCAMVLGNSSSGIWEAPSFGVPTVNIGDRQKGRVRAKTTLDCNPNFDDILKAMKRAMSKDFRDSIKGAINPYGGGNTSEKIISVIKDFLFSNKIDLKKKFWDIKF
ncbi:MAG: UDP-N-acetylglucosamine 2-epimerase [Oscillospiraceae bacterium]|jgi:GDP/UDP-N,N'-diacetylbacillosamine 2-epimerase (hydrolysing)|nr:UDP-N-acetylglucosamine 2-epimerase [Oscillospiraceae bacterium]